MSLEDNVVSGSFRQPEIKSPEVSVRTIREIRKNIAFYEISTKDGPVQIRKDYGDFVGNLSEGDRILVVKQGPEVIFAYGPLEDGKTYSP